MQTQRTRFWLLEGFWFLLGLGFFNFCFMLDEPLFDFSDWSVVHILCLFVGFVSIITENKVRAHLGQWAPKDLTVMGGILSFWLSVQFYTTLVIAVSAVHFLVPAEMELFEATELFVYLLTWFDGQFLIVAVLLFFLYFFISAASTLLTFGQNQLLALHLVVVVLILLLTWVLLFWDLATSSLSAWVTTLDADDFYAHPRAGTAYDNWVGVVDVFDWHKTSPRPQALRFEELYTFFLTLVVFLSVTIALFWWAYQGLALLGISPLTPTQATLGVGARLVEASFWLTYVGFLSLVGASLRICLKDPTGGFRLDLLYLSSSLI